MRARAVFPIFLLLFSLVIGSNAFGAMESKEMDQKYKGLKVIKTDDLKKLIDEKADLLLINTLSPIEFAESKIEGSVNIPYMHLKHDEAKLPEDKNKMLVFYCKGPK